MVDVSAVLGGGLAVVAWGGVLSWFGCGYGLLS